MQVGAACPCRTSQYLAELLMLAAASCLQSADQSFEIAVDSSLTSYLRRDFRKGNYFQTCNTSSWHAAPDLDMNHHPPWRYSI